MKIDFFSLAMKLPVIIQASMKVAKHFKGEGKDKKAAVLASIPDALEAMEAVAGRDLLNDETIAGLVSAFIDAEALALKTRKALEEGILAKRPPLRAPSEP